MLRTPEGEAELTYSIASPTLIIADHTGVPDSLRGTGAGRALVERLVADARAEGFKVVADALVTEAGVHPMLHRSFVAPLLDDDAVTGVVTESKAGREAILASRVIDATGDADVAHRAGAPTR
ncbi:MAG TPA: FAD-dependent oxidoreductase, partial [Acidimicrobiales bacterium]|nr:FAD-dependent oxidoreductase [Acidimicrobiales bacterium]